jgi:hypothetical protein
MPVSTRSTRDFGDVAIDDLGEFGDRHRGHHGHRRGHGDAAKKLKRPYKRSVKREGRKLVGKHKIGQVPGAKKSEFKWVTRGGGVYAATVSKGKGRKATHKKPAKKRAKKAARKK